jgi:SM-20-related protein
MVFIGTGFDDETLGLETLRYFTEFAQGWSAGLVGAHGGEVRKSVRQARVLELSPAIEEYVKHAVSCRLDAICSELSISLRPPVEWEIEGVVHADRGFYKRHIDTFTGSATGTSSRFISCVLYLHETPKMFSGGALRLYPIGPRENAPAPIDIEPSHNRLVAFPSWLPHEVMPVSVPSGSHRDCRYSINIWLSRKRR